MALAEIGQRATCSSDAATIRASSLYLLVGVQTTELCHCISRLNVTASRQYDACLIKEVLTQMLHFAHECLPRHPRLWVMQHVMIQVQLRVRSRHHCLG